MDDVVDRSEPQVRTRGWRRQAGLALLALALLAPAGLPYLAHYLIATGGSPTGFIQLEMPYYLANAREHFDGGSFHWMYGNPYSPRYETKRLYFQPQTLALALLWEATGWAPGTVFVVFGLLAGWACARVIIALYEAVVGLGDWPRRVGLVLFFWGGGLLALTGYAAAWLSKPEVAFENFLDFDPFGGWWFLNLGRNLVLPTEAYYHALFLGTILCLVHRRYRAALALTLLTSLSHPFTGIELALVVAVWGLLERRFVENHAVPRRFVAGALAIVGFHLGYYMVFLGQDPEHRVLAEQWKLAWTLDASAFVPADLLVGLLAFWRLRTLGRVRAVLAEPANRLFLTWYLVAFALANHEFAIRPVQPLHFTRGYNWAPLFLLGAASLVALLRGMPRRLGPVAGRAAVAGLVGLFLLDNALWLGSFPIEAARGRWIADVRLDADQQRLLDWLESPEHRGSVLLCRDPMLSFLAGTYSPVRAWQGHGANTPNHGRRVEEVAAFFDRGEWLGAWDRRPLLVVFERDVPAERRAAIEAKGGRATLEAGRFRVYSVPRPAVAARASDERRR